MKLNRPSPDRRLQPAATRALGMLLLAMFLTLGNPVSPAFAQDDPGADDAPGTLQLPPRLDPERQVHDNADVLTDEQERGFEGDLDRAQRLGIEALVYTRLSTDSQEQSQAVAEAIRTDWGVESSSGADDGLVLLISVNFSDLETSSVVASWGEETFPIRQLDEETFASILEDEMRPAVAEGRYDLAAMYGVRRLLNYAEYSPPDPAPRSDLQESARVVAVIAGPLLLQLAVLGYIVAGALTDRRLAFLPSRTALAWYAIIIVVAAAVTGTLAIYGRHGPASLIALGVFLWGSCGVPLLIAYLARRPASRRRIVVGPPRPDPARRSRKQAGMVVSRG